MMGLLYILSFADAINACDSWKPNAGLFLSFIAIYVSSLWWGSRWISHPIYSAWQRHNDSTSLLSITLITITSHQASSCIVFVYKLLKHAVTLSILFWFFSSEQPSDVTLIKAKGSTGQRGQNISGELYHYNFSITVKIDMLVERAAPLSLPLPLC